MVTLSMVEQLISKKNMCAIVKAMMETNISQIFGREQKNTRRVWNSST